MALITTPAAAKKLRLEKSGVRRYAKEGRIVGARKIGRDWLYDSDFLEIRPPPRPQGGLGHKLKSPELWKDPPKKHRRKRKKRV